MVCQKKIDWNQKKSTDFNRELAIEQDLQIKMFLEQHSDWKMISTGSGLRYYIYENGKGAEAAIGMTAQVETEISLLDGTQCYKTASDEMEEFVIDKKNCIIHITHRIHHHGVRRRRWHWHHTSRNLWRC